MVWQYAEHMLACDEFRCGMSRDRCILVDDPFFDEILDKVFLSCDNYFHVVPGYELGAEY